jgi:hypothetical protein
VNRPPSHRSVRHAAHGSGSQVASSDIDALVAIYGFTEGEFLQAVARTELGHALAPGNVRSWIHEQQHLYHSVTTPFGLFIWRLRTLQTGVVRNLLLLLPNQFKLPVKLPLFRYIESLDDSVRRDLQFSLTLWFAVEILLTIELGGADAMLRLLRRSSYTGLHPGHGFRLLQVNLAVLYQAFEQQARMQGAVVDATSSDLVEQLKGEPIDQPEQWGSYQRAVIALRTFEGEFGTLPAVLESAAYAAELWGASRVELQKRAPQSVAVTGGDSYILPFFNTVDRTPTADGHQTIMTHLAACDLAMFAPVLPQHFGIRRRGLVLDELHPALRLGGIQSVMGRVRPMEDPADYHRFLEDICDALNWVPLRQMLDMSDVLRPAIPVDIRDDLYDTALSFRRGVPTFFVTPGLDLIDAPATAQFRRIFAFPVIQFDDIVLYHKDKTLLDFFQINYLLYQWHRQLFTGTPRQLRLPWRSTAEEVDNLKSELSELMNQELGREVRPPPIVATFQEE